MRTKTIQSWDELVREVYEDSHNKDLKRYRSPYAFRGLPQDYPLNSSLMRLHEGASNIPDIERYLFRNFKKYAHQEVAENSSEWHWLAIAQHHGLPTRLLDWTYSPFVAMHFATVDLSKMDKDAVIWCVNFVKVHEFLPRPLKLSIAEARASIFTIEMILAKYKSFENFDREKGTVGEFALFFEPPSLDPRIINQVALFSFMNRPAARLDEWLEERSKAHPEVCKKIRIPGGDVKWEIRDKLDQANVNERVLFPGLDGLSSWLKRWYSPKAPPKTPDPAKSAIPSRSRRGMS